jgi:UDP-N-acetylmuramate dehydrogenase
MLDILAARRRFPRKIPNCGSVFVSEPTTYREWGSPGAMIERVGLKGIRIGGALVASEHANFILNTGGASASDVLGLIGLARLKVWETTGNWMQTEVRYVSEQGMISPAVGPEGTRCLHGT